MTRAARPGRERVPARTRACVRPIDPPRSAPGSHRTRQLARARPGGRSRTAAIHDQSRRRRSGVRRALRRSGPRYASTFPSHDRTSSAPSQSTFRSTIETAAGGDAASIGGTGSVAVVNRRSHARARPSQRGVRCPLPEARLSLATVRCVPSPISPVSLHGRDIVLLRRRSDLRRLFLFSVGSFTRIVPMSQVALAARRDNRESVAPGRYGPCRSYPPVGRRDRGGR